MYSRNPWEQDDPTAPNYGAANYGQLQPQDAGQPAAGQGYQQPPAQWTPQARIFQQPAALQAPPQQQVESGRSGVDPTRMTGVQSAPTSQGGLGPAMMRVPDAQAPPPDQWSGRLLHPGEGPPPPDRLNLGAYEGQIPDVLRGREQRREPQAAPASQGGLGGVDDATREYYRSLISTPAGVARPQAAPPTGLGPTPTGYNPPAPPPGIPNNPWQASAQNLTPTPRALTMGQMDYTGPGRGGAQVNPMAFKGFNDERALSAGDAQSAKDAFRDYIGQTDFDVRGLTKEQTGEFLASQVVPYLESKGYPARVKPGAYDIIEVFSNERGWEPIDVIENAGSAEAAWQWGDRPGQGAALASGPLNSDLLQQAAGGAGQDELAMAQSLGIDTNNPLWRQMFEAWFSNQQGVDPAIFGLTPPPGA